MVSPGVRGALRDRLAETMLALPDISQVLIWLATGVALGAGRRVLLVIFPLIAVLCRRPWWCRACSRPW
jgi:hypothetical protein